MAKKTKISHQIKKKPVTFKQNALSETATMMRDSQAVILTEYRGLTVPQINEIRGKLKETGADFSVVKNTLFKRSGNRTRNQRHRSGRGSQRPHRGGVRYRRPRFGGEGSVRLYRGNAQHAVQSQGWYARWQVCDRGTN